MAEASTRQVLFWSYSASTGFAHEGGTNCRTVFTAPRQTPCVPRSINCFSTNHCLDLRYCCLLFDSSAISFSDLTMFLRRKYCYFTLMLGCLIVQSSGGSQPSIILAQKVLPWLSSLDFRSSIGDFSPGWLKEAGGLSAFWILPRAVKRSPKTEDKDGYSIFGVSIFLQSTY